jgi:hypothetical protein
MIAASSARSVPLVAAAETCNFLTQLLANSALGPIARQSVCQLVEALRQDSALASPPSTNLPASLVDHPPTTDASADAHGAFQSYFVDPETLRRIPSDSAYPAAAVQTSGQLRSAPTPLASPPQGTSDDVMLRRAPYNVSPVLLQHTPPAPPPTDVEDLSSKGPSRLPRPGDAPGESHHVDAQWPATVRAPSHLPNAIPHHGPLGLVDQPSEGTSTPALLLSVSTADRGGGPSPPGGRAEQTDHLPDVGSPQTLLARLAVQYGITIASPPPLTMIAITPSPGKEGPPPVEIPGRQSR